MSLAKVTDFDDIKMHGATLKTVSAVCCMLSPLNRYLVHYVQ